jgi:hypothetical protein
VEKCDEDGHLLVIHWIRNMLEPGGEALQSIQTLVTVGVYQLPERLNLHTHLPVLQLF